MREDAQRTPALFGREDELAAMQRWLASEGPGPLVVTGHGGIGKTALVRELLRRFPAGRLVDCSNARTAEDVTQAIGASLGLSSDALPSVEQLKEAARNAKLSLLVLDNLEQLATEVAALDPYFTLVSHVALTSRVLLDVEDHVSLALAPLSSDDGKDGAAVKILLARRNIVGDTTISEDDRAKLRQIVRLTDGIPLALELAARKVATMGIDWTATRLERGILELRGGESTKDGASRMEACIRWSWDLLNDEQRWALAALSLFNNAFSFVEAELLLGKEDSVVEGLVDQLVAQSLLFSSVQNAATFRLPIPVREYGRRAYEALPDRTEIFTRYANAILDAAFPSGTSAQAMPAELRVLERLRPDLEAIAMSGGSPTADPSEANLVHRALLGLSALALGGAHSAPYLAALQSPRAKSAYGALDSHQRHAWLLAHCAVLRTFSTSDKALEIARQANALQGITEIEQARGFIALSHVLVHRGEHEDAYGRALAALDLAREQSDVALERDATIWLAYTSRGAGYLAEAREYAKRGLALARRESNDEALSELSELLAYLHIDAGELSAAQVVIGAALTSPPGRVDREAHLRVLLGDTHTATGRFDEAEEQYALAEARALATNRRLQLTSVNVSMAILNLARRSPLGAKTAALRVVERDESAPLWPLALAILAAADAQLGLMTSADEFAERAYRESEKKVYAPFFVRSLLLGYELARLRVGAKPTEARAQIERTLKELVHVNPQGSSHFASNGDVRLVLQVYERDLHELGFTVTEPTIVQELVVTESGAATFGSRSLDLSLHPSARNIVTALAKKPGKRIDIEHLFQIGWPTERELTRNGRNRIYVTISLLRKNLLGAALARDDEGYFLDCVARLEG